MEHHSFSCFKRKDYPIFQVDHPMLPAGYPRWLLMHAFALARQADALEVFVTLEDFLRYWREYGSYGDAVADLRLLRQCTAQLASLAVRGRLITPRRGQP
jgi:hypothetical protein